jgi:hypothetical protein
MKSIRYQGDVQVVPLLIKEGAVNDESNFVKVNNAHWVTFLIAWGDADTAVTFQLEASSANSTNASSQIVAMNHFRVSGAASAGSDTWSAWSDTANDSTGIITMTATTDQGKLYQIELDPRTLPDGLNYVHVVTAATSYNSPTPAEAIIAILETRYSQDIPLSST